jgi:GTPase SAR1 family protein
MIIYAIDNRKTFEEALNIYKWVLRMRHVDKIPTILCGNKSDLMDLREVPRDEGEKKAKDNNMMFLETSAKTGDNVTESFHALVRCTPRTGKKYKVKFTLINKNQFIFLPIGMVRRLGTYTNKS